MDDAAVREPRTPEEWAEWGRWDRMAEAAEQFSDYMARDSAKLAERLGVTVEELEYFGRTMDYQWLAQRIVGAEVAMPEVPSRESAANKARRYLTEGRVTIDTVRSYHVRAVVRGDGAVWRVRVDGLDRTCTCPAQGLCAHILAVGLVTAPVQPTEGG